MHKSGKYREKAFAYQALAAEAESQDLRGHYKAMAKEYRELADAFESLLPKLPKDGLAGKARA